VAAARVTPPVPACDLYPRQVPGVEVHRRADDGAIVLRGGCRYVQVSARALEIWDALDGIANLRELAVRFSGTGAGGDVGSALVKLVRTLAQSGMITLEPPGSEPPAAVRKPAIPRRNALGAYLTFPLRPTVDAAYRLVGWAFHPAIVTVAAVIAIAGCAAFVLAPHRTLLLPSATGFAGLGLAMCIAVCMHEAGHALVLRHCGGIVSRGGVGWYWFSPTGFVDTSDAHLLPRDRRIAVCLAGPAVDLTLAGSAALGAAFAHDPRAAAWAWSFAAARYLGFLWNLNPLLELDGYYALTDLLGRPNLRQEGFAQLFRWRRPTDRIALAYGACAVVYGAAYVTFAVPALVRATLGAWLAPFVPAVIVAGLPVAAAVAAAAAVVSALGRSRLSRKREPPGRKRFGG